MPHNTPSPQRPPSMTQRLTNTPLAALKQRGDPHQMLDELHMLMIHVTTRATRSATDASAVADVRTPQVVMTDLLAQARQLLIDDACQRSGVQTHWATTRAEAEALLAPWWPLA